MLTYRAILSVLSAVIEKKCTKKVNKKIKKKKISRTFETDPRYEPRDVLFRRNDDRAV